MDYGITWALEEGPQGDKDDRVRSIFKYVTEEADCLRDILHDIGSISSEVGLDSPFVGHKRKPLCTNFTYNKLLFMTYKDTIMTHKDTIRLAYKTYHRLLLIDIKAVLLIIRFSWLVKLACKSGSRT